MVEWYIITQLQNILLISTEGTQQTKKNAEDAQKLYRKTLEKKDEKTKSIYMPITLLGIE